MDRRQFLKLVGSTTGGILLSPHLPGLLSAIPLRSHSPYREGSYFQSLVGGRVECFLCPHHCFLDKEEVGICRTRFNRGGKLYTAAFDNPCIISKEPVAKGPLFHFLPGTTALALSTAGCNLRCHYCQNWQISMSPPWETENLQLNSREAVDKAIEHEVSALVYTYAEPVVYYEYLLEVAARARQAGLRNCVSTSAYIRPQPLRELCRKIDSFTVALKGFNEVIYRETFGGKLKPVLDSLSTIKKEGNWLEVVYLLVPTINTNPSEIRSMCHWIRLHLGEDTPLHFARFWPAYRMKNLPPTPVGMMEDYYRLARESGLTFVYLDNLPGHRASHTYCPGCGRIIIERLGFSVISSHLRGGKCRFCGREIPGVWS